MPSSVLGSCSMRWTEDDVAVGVGVQQYDKERGRAG